MRDLPFSNQAEESVLGAILIEPDCYLTVAPILTDVDFYRAAHQSIYRAIGSLWQQSKPVDPVTLVEELRSQGELGDSGGIDYIAVLIDAVPSAANVKYHAEQVRDYARRRRIIGAANAVVEAAYEASMDALVSKGDGMISAMSGTQTGGFSLVKTHVWPAIEEIEGIINGDESVRGIETGFSDLDKKLIGFHPGDMIVIAGRPSMGKTALGMNMLCNMAFHGHKVGIVSLEMSSKQLTMRMIASEARLDMQAIRNGRYIPDASTRIATAAGRINAAPIFVDDTPVSRMPELLSKISRLVRNEGVEIVLIDYLQLMEGNGNDESRQQEISKLSRGIKLMAKKLDIPVIVLSQLSRAVEARRDKRPMLSDLRESGAIEQDADVVMFVFRPEYYAESDEAASQLAGKAEVIIAKQRNGAVGSVLMHFTKEYARFDLMDRGVASNAA